MIDTATSPVGWAGPAFVFPGAMAGAGGGVGLVGVIGTAGRAWLGSAGWAGVWARRGAPARASAARNRTRCLIWCERARLRFHQLVRDGAERKEGRRFRAQDDPAERHGDESRRARLADF